MLAFAFHFFSCFVSTPSFQENPFNYDKGVLAEILEPIMGKGLIPADLVTWKVGPGPGTGCLPGVVLACQPASQPASTLLVRSWQAQEAGMRF